MKLQENVHVEYPVEFDRTFERVETIIIPKYNRKLGVIIFSHKGAEGKWIAKVYLMQLDEQTNTYSFIFEIGAFDFINESMMTKFIERATNMPYLRFLLEWGPILEGKDD